MKYIFEVAPDGSLHFEGRRVILAAEAARRLRRTRRHVYRLIDRGWLSPAVTFAHQHFFDVRDIEALKTSQAAARTPSVPRRLAPLFPEYDWRRLHLDRDADVIMTRVLERGDSVALRWLLRHFSRARRKQVLHAQGRRLLSSRALRFWSWLWKVPVASEKGAWRQSGRALGGTA